jgi:hypothetical protein
MYIHNRSVLEQHQRFFILSSVIYSTLITEKCGTDIKVWYKNVDKLFFFWGGGECSTCLSLAVNSANNGTV